MNASFASASSIALACFLNLITLVRRCHIDIRIRGFTNR
jgi:hypothetical protein